MKARIAIPKFLIVLCIAFASTVLFGQTTTYTWTNQNPAHLAGTGDMNVATNWDPNGVPNPMTGPDVDGNYGDLLLFDGRTTGPLSVTESGGTLAGFGGMPSPSGARIRLTANQTNSVMIYSVLSVSGGLRMNYFDCQPGSGGLILGDRSLNCLDIIAGEINGQIFGFTNNSSTPCEVTESVRWRQGGAGAHPYVFAGTGDWIVNNHMRSAGSSAVLVQKFGPGTMTWTGTNIPNANFSDQLGNPITIGGGTMIWKTSDLVGGAAGNPNIVHNGALFKYDAPVGTCTNVGVISGTGPIQINAGTFMLLGQNTITGNWTLSGGTVIAGSTEAVGLSGPLGNGGTISFSGGTLQYSANNTFDYSSRFSTAASQAISIDTAGQNVTFATGLTSSGGTLAKTNSGTLTLASPSSHSGATTISGGKLVFEAAKIGTGDISVADGATLGVFDTGTPVTPATLILGTSAGANLEFDNINSTSTAPLNPGAITSVGTILISINSGTFSIGQSYPLLQWTSGSAPAVNLVTVSGANGTLSTNGNKIQFNVSSIPPVWTGANSGNWSDPNNWTTPYSDPNSVRFDDTAPGTTNVIVDVQVQPASVTINNATKNYSITSSGINNIAGGTGLSKSGSGTLTLSGGANTYTGVTTLKGGAVIVGALANGGVASDIGAASSSAANLVFDGGALQYTGGATNIDRLFTVGLGGGTIDSAGSGALTLNNPGTINLGGTLTLAGSTAETNTLASALINSGGLIKIGTGTWVLAGTNSYGGGTAVANGVLQIGANGGTGSLGGGNVSIATGTALDFRRTGSLTVPGAISGNGSVSQNGSGTVILANNNSYTGGTTINAGTLQLGNGGATGSLNSSMPIVNDSLLVFNISGSFSYSANGVISGTGNVIVQGGGVIKAIGNNTYTGWTRIDGGTTFWPREGQDGFLASSVITNNGTLRIVSQDALFTYPGPIRGSGRVQIGANNPNVGVITLTGTNTYTGGTFIGGNTLILGDGATPGAGAIAGNVQFVNNFTVAQDNPRTISFNRLDDFTFTGTITTNFTSAQSNLGIVQQNGTGTLTLTGANTYAGGTVINAGALQVGNGGTSGSLGTGNVANNSLLIFNRSDNVTFGAVISGWGSLVKASSGSLTLAAMNTYTGTTTVSNGTVIVSGDNNSVSTTVYGGTLGGTGVFYGPVTLAAGTTLAPGASIGSVGTLTVNNNLIFGGRLVIDVNKSLSPSNDFVVVNGGLTNTGTGAPGMGTLTVSNLGPALTVGDKFTLFNKPMQNGAAVTVTGAGATWANNLAVDGSISVAGFAAGPTLNFTKIGTSLQFSWSGTFKLQAQTNTLSVGLSANWADYPGGGTSPVTVPIDVTNGAVFFRLISTGPAAATTIYNDSGTTGSY